MSSLPVNLADLVRDRIQKDFVALIPEENWKTLVDAAIRDFTAVSRERDRHGQNPRRTTDLEELIYEHIRDTFKAKIKEELGKPEYISSTYIDGFNIGPAVITEIIEKHGHKLFASLISSMVANTLANMRSNGY